MAEYPLPELVVTNDEKVKTELTGFTINEPLILGRALVAMGVDEAEVPQWRIFAGVPPNNVGGQLEKIAVIPPSAIDKRMRAISEEDNEFSYVFSFDKAASDIILLCLAYGIVATNRRLPRMFRNSNGNPTFAVASLFSMTSATFGLMAVGVDPGTAAGAGVAIGGSVLFGGHAITSNGRAVRKILNRAEDNDPKLEQALQRAVMPRYTRTV